DGDVVVVYRERTGEGRFSVRRRREFEDGRFEYVGDVEVEPLGAAVGRLLDLMRRATHGFLGQVRPDDVRFWATELQRIAHAINRKSDQVEVGTSQALEN